MLNAYYIADSCDLRLILNQAEYVSRLDRFLLVCRADRAGHSWKASSPRAEDAIRKYFGKQLISEYRTQFWPGSKLLSDNQSGHVFICRFDLNAAKTLIDIQPELFAWLHSNDLPEDLCLLRKDSKWPALFSVTHERDAWEISDTPSVKFEEKLSVSEIEEWIPKIK